MELSSARRVRTLVVLLAVSVTVVLAPPGHGWTGLARVTLIVLLPVAAGAWALRLLPHVPRRLATAGPIVGALAGALLQVVAPNGPALAFAFVGCMLAGMRFPPVGAAGLTVLTMIVATLGRALDHPPGQGADLWGLVTVPAVLTGALLLGLVRRQRRRLRQEEELLRVEQDHGAALAERARLAREIHDVLAHSLSALSLQLETADALLERGDLDRARALVAGAGRLAREGLVETRRAVGALRGESRPLAELLDALAAGYRADAGATATVAVRGEPRPLPAEASLALFRTAQEAMTNVRKHAPGAAVTLDLAFAPDDVSLRVVNGAPPPGPARPLAPTGGGYGLTGLRERAELVGAAFDAGPCEGGFRVQVRVAT